MLAESESFVWYSTAILQVRPFSTNQANTLREHANAGRCSHAAVTYNEFSNTWEVEITFPRLLPPERTPLCRDCADWFNTCPNTGEPCEPEDTLTAGTPEPVMPKADEQPDLFKGLPSNKLAKFRKYHADNPQVYEQFKRFTFELINAGAKHCGAQAVIERIRWETRVTGNDGFKVNNNYSSFYSRLFEKDYPQHFGIFRKRTSAADEVLTKGV